VKIPSYYSSKLGNIIAKNNLVSTFCLLTFSGVKLNYNASCIIFPSGKFMKIKNEVKPLISHCTELLFSVWLWLQDTGLCLQNAKILPMCLPHPLISKRVFLFCFGTYYPVLPSFSPKKQIGMFPTGVSVYEEDACSSVMLCSVDHNRVYSCAYGCCPSSKHSARSTLKL
jgi:hypothetical protein